jgi:type II secretory pathway pseudopilin PulG
MALDCSTTKERPARTARQAAGGLSTTEMLVAMAILSVLVVISVTVLSGSKRGRAQAQCAANLRSIGIAFSMYASDYKDSYPIPTPEAQWEDLLRPYVARATFHCPADDELFAALDSSYDWRDTGDAKTTLAGRLSMLISATDLALAFDALPEWHQKGSIQVLHVNQSVDLMSVPSFFQDIRRSPVSP